MARPTEMFLSEPIPRGVTVATGRTLARLDVPTLVVGGMAPEAIFSRNGVPAALVATRHLGVGRTAAHLVDSRADAQVLTLGRKHAVQGRDDPDSRGRSEP